MRKNVPTRNAVAGDKPALVPVLAAMEPRLLLAGVPTLAAGVMIQDGGQTLDVGDVSIPAIADWNNDGYKDLLVGRRNEGNVLVYLNQGTDADPAFDGGSLVQSGGSPISTTYG